MKPIAIIDGDLIKFRSAISAEGEEEPYIACARANAMLAEMLYALDTDEYELWLSGKDNFRYKVYPEYKGTRKAQRPRWENDVKEFLINECNAQILDGAEADDALGFRMAELLAEGKRPVCVTNDKDNKQTVGEHYDPIKKEFFTVTPEEADRFFYYQLLVGDSVDNIKGVPGIGPKKAEKLLSEYPPEEWEEVIKELYSCEEEYEQNAKCLWIWRKRGDIWQKNT